MLWLTRQSLKRSSVTILIAFAFLVAGVIATGSFRQELFPDISFPIVSVSTVYPGASADTMDEEVTNVIEKAVSGVAGLESIQSTSNESFAITVIQFDVDIDPKVAKQEVQEKLSAINLPEGANDPNVGTFGFGSLPILTASASGSDLSQIQEIVEAEAIPELSALAGVSNVSISGGEQEKLVINLDPAKMVELGVTQCAVAQAIQANNSAIPAGTVYDENIELPIRVSGSYTTLEEVENIVVGFRGTLPGGGASGGAGGFGGGGFPCIASLGSQPAPTATPEPTALPEATPTTEVVTATGSLVPPAFAAQGITSLDQITPDVLALVPDAGLSAFDLALALNLPADTQAALAERLPAPEVPANFASFGITTPEQLTPDVLANVPAAGLTQFPVALALALPAESQALVAEAALAAAPAAPADSTNGASDLPAGAEQLFGFLQVSSFAEITPEKVATIPAQFLGQFTPELIALMPADTQQAIADLQANPDAADAPFEIPDELLVRIKDVATVSVDNVGGNTITRTNGEPSLGIDVVRDTTGNTVEIVDGARAIFADIETRHDIKFTIVREQATPVIQSIDAVTSEGIIGAIVAILVIFLFLRSIRSTLVTAVSIPLSVLVALLFIRIQGFSLNIMTLGGLTVAVGRVVDDSIVVLENIYRYMRRGDSINTSVIEGTREVAGAITSSTLTTVCVFLPLGVVGGIVSKFFLPFALTVSYALLASLVVSLTIVPLLARLFIRPKENDSDEKESFLQRIYTPMLTWSLRSWATKATVIAVALLLFFGSLGVASLLKFTFLPDDSDKNVQISMQMPAGTSLDITDAEVAQVETLINPYQADGTVIDVQTIVGRGGSGQQFDANGNTSSTNQARLSLTVDNDKVDPIVFSKDLERQIRDLGIFEAVEARTIAADGGGPGGTGLDIVLYSPSIEDLRTANTLIMDTIGGDKLSGQYAVTNIGSSLAEVKPELEVRINPEAATGAGSATALIGLQIRSLLSSQNAGRLPIEGYDQPLDTVVNVDFDRFDVETLRAIPVGTFAPTALENVADIRVVEGATTITRIDGNRAASISGQFTSDDTINTQNQILADIQALELPASVTIQAGAQASSNAETLANMGLALLVAVVLVYVVMVITFGSLSTPFVILFTLPLAIIGAILGLYVTGKPLGITSLIGVLMLIGIVVTNAIVLLELVEQYRERGMSLYDSIVRGGKVRLRPILMTALATMVALIPLALGLKKGGFIAADLAVVVIGGLFTSTFLTLLVIPVLYSIFEGIKGRFGWSGHHDNTELLDEPAEA